MSLRDDIVEAMRGIIGESYYSMNYGAEDGFGGIGTHYVGEGFGCAQSTSYAYNTVLSTRYLGSVYNFAGDALGQSVNQGGGEFYFVDEPEAGDSVIYIAAGHNGEDYSDYGHIALYVGDGLVVGAMGRGTPYSGNYLNIGISETTVAGQSIGGGWRYIRCSRLDESEPEHEEKTEENGEGMLACIISIDDDHSGYKKGMQVLWTPMGFEYINHPDSISLLDEMSEYYTGKPLMRVHSGHDHPWVERLEQVTIGDGAKTKGTVR